MSRKIDTDPSYLTRTVPIVTAYPFTINCWFLPSTADLTHRLVGLADTSGGTENQWALQSTTSDFLLFNCKGGPLNNNSITTNSMTLNEWNMATAVAASSTSRRVILNADFANEGINTTDATPAGLDNTVIGAFVRESVFASGTDFLIANVAVWNVALVDDEISALDRGAFPHEIRRGSLIAHWRLLGNTSPEPDAIVPNQSMTLVSAPVKGNHQDRKLWTPPPPTSFVTQPGPSGGAIQRFAFEYKH